MRRFAAPIVLILALFALRTVSAEEKNVMTDPIPACEKLIQEGMPRDALDILQPWLLSPEAAKGQNRLLFLNGIRLVVDCLEKLNRMAEADVFLEKAAENFKENWRGLYAVAAIYGRPGRDDGFIIDGQFQRGPNRGGGRWASAGERDRVRALQLCLQAMPMALNDNDKKEVAALFTLLAEVLIRDRGGDNAWKLQILTDTEALPDYDEERRWHRFDVSRAPVDAEGNPLFYGVPDSFESAKNDGERWRWALEQVVENDPERLVETLYDRAIFSRSQFGEETLMSIPFFHSDEADDADDAERRAGIWNLETLDDRETIARLATGVKRFAIPDEFHYIFLLKKIVEVGPAREKRNALESLAEIAENRRQFDKAETIYRQLIRDIGDESDRDRKFAQERLDRIVGNWGRFEPAESKVAGREAELQYVFRNGKKVKLSARAIDVPRFLDDIKAYLKSKPERVDWSRMQVERIGWNLVMGDDAETTREKYLLEETVAWSVDLEPAPGHYDRRATISVPVRKAGAYLVRADMEGGNTEYVLLWLQNTAIVRKAIDDAQLYFLADAETGRPVPSTELDFFGYKTEWVSTPRPGGRQRQANEPRWSFNEFSARTDENGLYVFERKDQANRLNWLVTARDGEGRFAYFGFSGIWFNRPSHDEYEGVKAFFISDRPVYRPGDTVEMKVWVATARYDRSETNDWAGKEIKYEIYDARHEKILEKSGVRLDARGGLVDRLDLPKDASLGDYQVVILDERGAYGNGSFRVEEYRKPEYEVSVDAPEEPVRLGETIKATIRAAYYFGSPVTGATVKYKVLREKYDDAWYPVRPWDWFYGSGYGWLAYDAAWLPGWNRWGACRPAPFWFPRPSGPPEVVAEREVPIGEDGTVDVEIDTSLAEAMFPGESQRYSITAEVVDHSRRTIVGSGSVLVSKEPFKIHAWVDRGWYGPGQKIEANFQARRLDGKPVAGSAEVDVSKISYTPQEAGTSVLAASVPAVSTASTKIHTAAVEFDVEGKASLSLNAAEPGQYRISCKLDGMEGGYVFNVYGKENKNNEPGTDTAGTDVPASLASLGWKFNALELIPDKAEFKPGENVALRINSDRADAFILLFVKSVDGVASKPRVVRLDGKSAEIPIPVEWRDMPNFFVEALLVSDGRVVEEMREIVVPPQQKIVDVEVKPSAEAYKPGQKASAELIVTDLAGTPVSGQTVVSIYDKSVEYISGGSNVADIREFFWKWRRHHHPQSESNLERFFPNMPQPGKPGMESLGIFGGTEREDAGVGVRKQAAMGGRFFAGDVVMNAAPMMAEGAVDAAMPVDAMVMADAVPAMEAGAADDTPQGVEPTIRQNFADTAFWIGVLETDENGKARIELDMPESLTTWKINVWNMSAGTRVGYGTAEVVTRKDLILRMQTPRFLVEKDQCVFSANVHNYLANEKEVKVVIDLKSPMRSEAELGGESRDNPEASLRCASGSLEKVVKIPAGGEARVDWTVEAKSAGDAVVVMKAVTDEESDAMQKTLPVYVHGMLKQEAFSGYVPPDKESGTIEIRVPDERKPERTKLTVRFSPTLAASMIDALPYLVDYPYGCTEQTLNRFLPTVIVQEILIDMNVDLEKLKAAKTNLNAQELGGSAGPERKPATARRVEPVYDIDEVNEMIADGVEKLTNMQCSDGGWGWFGGYGERSSAHLTALVVHGLRLAQQNDVVVDEEVLQRGVEWLLKYQREQVELLKNASLSDEEKKRWKSQADETDAFVFMVLMNEMKSDVTDMAPRDPAQDDDAFAELFGKTLEQLMQHFVEMREFLWRDRAKLSLYGVAMYGIALSNSQDKNDVEKVAACVKMLEQYLVQDDENQTAWLDLARYSGWRWWCWYGSEYETQAYYLKLLMRTDPKSPVAPRLVKYLLNNRRHATYWNSTRDTAVCIEAFAEFLRATGEDKPNMTVEVLVDGQVKKTVAITPDNLFEIDNTLVLEGDAIASGTHKIELRKKGEGPIYFNAYLENFTLEDPIEKTGLEVKIERRIYKLVRDESAQTQAAGGRGQVVDMKVEKYTRLAASPGEALTSGDLVEIELVVESKNDYESIIIEDMKAAGLEPVDVRSGYTGNELGAYVEFRDERVAMFVYRLARGKHGISYRLRAEQPGNFSALPAKISAMYAPELKGNSDENKVKVVDE